MSSDSPVGLDGTATMARRFVVDFLRRTRFADRFPPRSAPPDVESKTRETIKSWNLDIPEDVYEGPLVCGLHIGYAAYQHTPHEIQIAVAIFTFCATMFDDAIGPNMEAMQEFIPRIFTGQPQLHTILTQFIQTASVLRGYLPEYTANMVHTCMMAYANEEVCGWKDANKLDLQPDAGNYIDYSRYKNGISEPYAACIWPSGMFPDVKEYIQAFPDTLIFINHTNDLMSFYKEVLENDEGCYVNRYGQLYGKTLEQSIEDLVEKIITTTERIRKILGEGRARDAWEYFASGFVHFGLYCPRYQWKEVIPEYF